MKETERLVRVVEKLRAEDGCPWDKAQTHGSLKPACIEEAAEVLCGINILEETGNADNLREELGDLLLQVVMHAQIAAEEGHFTFEDVAKTAADKMVRRHPHIFAGADPAADPAVAGAAADPGVQGAGGGPAGLTPDQVRVSWEEIKKAEKAGREEEEAFVLAHLETAMNEARELIDVAKRRKGFGTRQPEG